MLCLPAVSASVPSLSQPIPLTVGDCRGLVKTLVCGMKTITWGVGSCKVPGSTVDFCECVCVCAYVCCCMLTPPPQHPTRSCFSLTRRSSLCVCSATVWWPWTSTVSPTSPMAHTSSGMQSQHNPDHMIVM